ncbi:M81 family metallopeptidase [Elioraea rosea]|uniref:M81 family metallopeptidase n=1 Tax=Elioraea rosea TaxID=2492390 RepID=UPI00118468C9|nr:M81 family metallopeptidase [Elioraea rosea]
MPHLAVARFWFEGNSFTPTPTTREAFASREWVSGTEAIARYRGTGTELGGLAGFLDANAGWTADVILSLSAQPGGPLTKDIVPGWLETVTGALARGGYDAVYLSLHGGGCAEDDPAPELTILRAVRAATKGVPLGVSFDIHGNLAPEIASLMDCASAYRTHPHIDMAETAGRVLAMLDATVAGRISPVVAIAKVPKVIHSFHMRSEAGPMAELWAEAEEEEVGPILDASPFGGFSWGDTPFAGPSILVTADRDRRAAQAVADRLAASLSAKIAAGRFSVTLPTPEAALETALAAPPGLVAVLDPADNPLSGGIADTPGVLRALLARAPDVPVLFAFLHDAETVEAARAAGLGGALTRPLAARHTVAFGPPVTVAATVERLTEGRFVNEGPMERGAPVDLGPTCVLRVGTVRVIVTSRREAAIDPGFFALHGIDLGATRLIVNKAKNHFRAAFASRLAALVECDSPGPAALDLLGLPFRHVPASWRTP